MTAPVVLIVDDEADIRMALADMARVFGWTPIQAASGRDAHQILQDNPRVQVVICDLHMPRGTGLEFLAQAGPLLRERNTLWIWVCSRTRNTPQRPSRPLGTVISASRPGCGR